MNLCLDKNAWYWYIAELEKVVTDEIDIPEAEKDIRNTMEQLWILELKQDRLARMFEYYKNNWEYYYLTDKIFTIN